VVEEGVGHLRDGEEGRPGGGEEGAGEEGGEGEGGGECRVIGWREVEGDSVGQGGGRVLYGDGGGGGGGSLQQEGGLRQRLAGRKTESGDGGVGAGGGRHAVESHCVEGEGGTKGRLRGSWLCLNDGSLYCSTHRACCPGWRRPA